jgi:FAD/FMN-containing dehydrogenase
MRSVFVSDGVPTIGAGARLGDVYDTLAAEGVTIPAGCGRPVGIAGLTLGGGLGILGRKHGLTSDHLLGAEVVLADGRVVEWDDFRTFPTWTSRISQPPTTAPTTAACCG